MKLSEIAWPIYKVGNNRPLEEDGVLFFLKESKDDTKIEIVDDKTLPLSTLAGRRLSLKDKKVPLYNLRVAIFFLGDLVKIATPNTWFIDSSGRLFQYNKTKFTKLSFRKITKVVRSVSATLIEVEGIPFRLMSLFPPRLEQKWAGVLKWNGSYILYGFYSEKHKDTVRKI